MRFFRSKVFIYYLLSYLLMLVLLTAYAGTSLRIIQRTVQQVSEEGNQLVLKQYGGIMETELDTLNRIYRVCMINDRIQELQTVNGKPNASKRYTMMECAQWMSTLKKNYALRTLSDLFFYFPLSDTVISEGGRRDATFFFTEGIRISGMTAIEAESMLRESWKQKMNFQSTEIAVNQVTGEESWMVTCALNRSLGYDSGVLIFLIDPTAVQQIGEGLADPASSHLMLYSTEGTPLFPESIISCDLYMDSDDFQVRYVMQTTKPGMFIALRMAGSQIRNAFLIAFGMGICLSAFLAYLLYRPVRMLWTQLQAQHTNHSNRFHNELKDIHTEVIRITDENQRQKYRLENVIPRYTAQLLTDLILGRTESTRALESLREYGIELLGKRLMILILQKKEEEEEHTAHSDAVQKIWEKVAKATEHYGSLICLTGEVPSALLIVHQGEREEILACIMDFVETCNADREQELYSIALGTDVLDPQELWKSWVSAERAMWMSDTETTQAVYAGWEMEKYSGKIEEQYQENDLSFMKAFRRHDSEHLRIAIDRIFGVEQSGRMESEIDWRMIHVLNLCADCLREAGISSEDLKNENLALQMRQIHQLPAFQEYVDMLSARTATKLMTTKAGDERLAITVDQYILGHYTDANLSVASIAEKVGLSQTRLSVRYYEQTGTHVSDAVHLTRIAKAIELMSNKEYSIINIARSVGYASDLTFSRAFKKYKGMTPGAYRKEYIVVSGDKP